jgi:hypothetical protein
MSGTKQEIERAAARLNAELAECHDCTMSVFRFAGEIKDHVVQMEAMKTATRMMQAQAAAALALQRLRSDNAHHTYTYVHEGRPPTPEKSKTNVPAKAAMNGNGAMNGHATDAETLHRA